MSDHKCGVQGCANPYKRGGYCYSHYMKNWRYGTPTPEHDPKWTDITGQRFGSLIVQRRDDTGWICRCDCGNETFASAGDPQPRKQGHLRLTHYALPN